MTIREILLLTQDYIFNQPTPVQIHREIFEHDYGLRSYNQIIRENIENYPGVYIWENAETNEIIYVGMAGKVKQNGEYTNHYIQNRLMASRGKDPISKKDIQTNKFIKNLLNEKNIACLNIYPLYVNDNLLPGYVEAVIINAFYQRNNCLPNLNSHF